MEFDRLEVYAAIDFIQAVIPKDTKTGKNCLFVRVEGDNIILTGGGEYASKKVRLVAQNTTTGKGKIPERFMIPKADLLAFREVMKEHKADNKRFQKDDPNKNLVEITGTELVSHDSVHKFQQPSFQFKDLEPLFEVKRAPVTEIPFKRKEVIAIFHGFKDSKNVKTTFCGDTGPIHFQEGDFEAILIPPVEKEEEGKQTTIDDE